VFHFLKDCNQQGELNRILLAAQQLLQILNFSFSSRFSTINEIIEAFRSIADWLMFILYTSECIYMRN